MADVEFSIQSSAGILPLVSTPGVSGPFRLMLGTSGLGLPVELVDIEPSAGGGGTVRGTRVGVRGGTLAIEVSGGSRSEVDANLRTLARHISARRSPQLVASIPDDGTYRLGFVRVGGGEDTYREWGDNLTEWSIEFEAPHPFWVRDEPVGFVVSQSVEDAVGLLPELAKLQVMSSVAIGELQVENPGDEPAPVSWRITGPGGPAAVSLDGRGFTVVDVLEPDEWIEIRRTPTGWRVVDQTGANRYSALGPAPKFPVAAEGVASGVAMLEEAGLGAAIAGWFNPLRKLVH